MNLFPRLLRGLGALLVVLTVVVGGAWALLRFGRLDALTSFDWSQVWVVADDGSLVLGIITLVGWLAWALATLSVVSELIAALTQQRWRLKLPGLALFAPASAVLVTAIVGLIAAQAVTPAPARAAVPEAPVTAPMAAPRNAPSDSDELASTEHAAEAFTHLVQPGDDLWSLAERYYSDGSRWRDIAAANDTVLLEGTDLLRPGMILVIPRSPEIATPVSSADDPGTVTVSAGDTLSALAAEHLGDPDRWPELVTANPELIADPDVIEPGWTLRLAPASSSDDLNDAATDATDSTDATGLPAPAPSVPAGQESVPEPRASVPASQLPTATAPTDGTSHSEETQRADLTPGWVAQAPTTFGLVLASALVGAYLWRRRQQQAARPIGRRLPSLSATADRLRGALTAATELAVPRSEAASRTGVWVDLGVGADGAIGIDLTAIPELWITGEHGDDISLATAIGLALACDGSNPGPEVIAAGPQFVRLRSLDDPRLQLLDNPADGHQVITELVAARSSGRPNGVELAQLRADADLAEAWRPIVVLLASPPAEPLPPDLAELGISVIVCADQTTAPKAATVVALGEGRARLLPGGDEFEPHLVSAPARRVLDEIFATANLSEYPPAPWWDHTPDPELPVLRVAAWPGSVEEPLVDSTIESEHPVVKLLGPVELAGTRGERPSRAMRQLQEYCAWLLEHPGSTAAQMADSLLVAEATRRSNMSRLRVWLGKDASGALYLPDAYSGRISLHPGITSDWEQLQLCVSGGVNRVSNAALIRALGMVRGAPMADAAPGQYHWAEQLRADMIACIRDIGVVLAERAIELGDSELARWAIDRAWLASPEDDLLVGAQLRLAHQAGDHAEVDRLVLALTRRSRLMGVDLPDQLVTLLQEVVEGRARLRA